MDDVSKVYFFYRCLEQSWRVLVLEQFEQFVDLSVGENALSDMSAGVGVISGTRAPRALLRTLETPAEDRDREKLRRKTPATESK